MRFLVISFRFYSALSAFQESHKPTFGFDKFCHLRPENDKFLQLAIMYTFMRFLHSRFRSYSALSAFRPAESLSALSAQNLFNTTPYSAVFCRSLHTDGKKWLSRQTFAYLATKLHINRLNENRQNLWENTSLNSDNRFSCCYDYRHGGKEQKILYDMGNNSGPYINNSKC